MRNGHSWKRSVLWTAAVGITVLALPTLAAGHLERPSYWPDPAPDTSVSPPAGGEVPTARSLASATTGEGPGQVLVVCKGEDGEQSLGLLRESIRAAKDKGGYKLRPSQPKVKTNKKKYKKLKRINKDLAADCAYDSVQAAVFDCRQQRPHRDHARPVSGVGFAEPAGERSDLHPRPSAGGRQRRPDAQLRVPGDLPERPEPDLRPGPGSGRRAARPAGHRPARDPRTGARRMRAVQPPDRGHRAEARGRAPRRGRRLRRRRAQGEARQLHEARRDARGPRRRIRRAQLPDARGRRARLLQRGGRRDPARQGEVLLGRRLRPPQLHLGPQPDQELRGLRCRRRGHLPGRVAGDRRADDRLLSGRPARQHRGQEVRHARLGPRLLGLDGQRGADHRQPHLRQHDRHLERHALGRGPPGVPGRQFGDRPQLHLLEQPRPLPRRRTAWTPWSGCRSAPASSTPG